MSFSFTKEWLVMAAERAIKTIAQTALATLAATQVLGLFQVDWLNVVGVSLLAGAMSVLTSIAFPSKEMKAVAAGE
jgi:hypothetical protein